MVKLTGPMMSVTALGKCFKVIVYSVWKGIQYGRMLVTPHNPQSGAQGDRRVMLGGLGRSAKYIQPDQTFEGFAKAVAPAGQSWISYYVDYIMTEYFPNVAGYDAVHDELAEHGAVADFHSEATTLGLTTFDLAYKEMTNNFSLTMQLYCMAKYSTDQYLLDNTKFNSAPYTKALATWVLADIQLMVADFSA
ncbi:hypothetical protein ES703_79269 [subsurface metagenome]